MQQLGRWQRIMLKALARRRADAVWPRCLDITELDEGLSRPLGQLASQAAFGSGELLMPKRLIRRARAYRKYRSSAMASRFSHLWDGIAHYKGRKPETAGDRRRPGSTQRLRQRMLDRAACEANRRRWPTAGCARRVSALNEKRPAISCSWKPIRASQVEHTGHRNGSPGLIWAANGTIRCGRCQPERPATTRTEFRLPKGYDGNCAQSGKHGQGMQRQTGRRAL